ncbi:potassium channel protein [Hymenobacter ginsengisoli]|uniref:Potassium channel protein n=1 Tax=Hymenobacter ginsengisoli TaxID=1051626 RepID=A0ABP8Q781_9BACT|nr:MULTISPECIES: potassium channel protein [unclassified Hymenobacter]MBO2031842.1 NAD-binding protein [Hymenobacter sp. BT559]
MLKQLNLTRLWLALGLLVFSFAVGVGGFMGIEHYPLLDAFYMTVITASTVGFGEVHPLSDMGRLFTSFYILFNLLVVAYLVSVLTTYIFDGELRHLFRMIRADQEIKSFRDHVIVCGFGRNGFKAYDELRHSGTRAVVIEQNQQLLTAANEAMHAQIPAVFGDATTETTLRQAGIEHARALITTLPKDADNVFVALTARELNPHLTIISRASARSSVSKLISAGANSVVMPDEIGGSHMANLIIRPEVIKFLDMISGLDPNKLRLEELPYNELKPSMRGQSIRELDVRSRTGATIIALRRGENGELEVSPAADYRTMAGDVLLVLGNEAQIQALHQQFK